MMLVDEREKERRKVRDPTGANSYLLYIRIENGKKEEKYFSFSFFFFFFWWILIVYPNDSCVK